MANRDTGRKNPFTAMLTQGVDQIMRQMMFCLPGRITAFDPDTQLAQVECGIKRLINGVGETIPVIDGVPVCFPGDNQWYHWHQITPGDTEGLIHFSQRAIDTWLDQGGPVSPHESRMLSEDDAFFMPGFRSKPGSISGFTNDGAGISSYDGNTRISMTSGEIVLTAGGGTLTLNASGLTHNGTNIGDDHAHGYTWTDPAGSGTTDGPE